MGFTITSELFHVERTFFVHCLKEEGITKVMTNKELMISYFSLCVQFLDKKNKDFPTHSSNCLFLFVEFNVSNGKIISEFI